VTLLRPSLRIENPLARRVARYLADLAVVVLVINVSVKFVDPKHRVVASLFVLASACGALQQLIAWHAGLPRPSVVANLKHGWAFVGVLTWFVATYPGSQQLFQGHLPQMPFSIQAVGAYCLLFAIATPFLRDRHLTRRPFDGYPQAIGSVLVTGSPLVAILVAAWIAVTGPTAWRALMQHDEPAIGTAWPALAFGKK